MIKIELIVILQSRYDRYIIRQYKNQRLERYGLKKIVLLFPMEEAHTRRDQRLLSALSDLKLEPRRTPTKQGDYEERRKIRKLCALKDDGEEKIFEHFIQVFRKKKPHDKEIISEALKVHFTFSYLERSIRESLLEKFSFCKVEQGNYLMKQGESASCFFILHEGKMSVEIDGQVRRKLSPADAGFGELALLFNAPRSASIKADSACYLWYIDRKTFKTAVQEIISVNYAENKNFIDKSLYLSELSRGQRQALTDIAMSQYYQKYSKICKEGDLAFSFYILKSGRVRRVKGGETIGFIEKGDIFEHQIALQEQSTRKETLVAEESSHVLALSVVDIQNALGKSLPIILIRNQLKNALKHQPFFSKLSKVYASKLLDSFVVVNVEKGKTVIDTYKKQRNSILFILEGNIEVTFPKLLNAKSGKHIQASLKEFKKEKENFDKRELFGVEALKRATSCQKNDEYYDINVQFQEKGKIARTSLTEIEKYLGCSLPEAIKRSAQQKEERRIRVSRVSEMRDVTRTYNLNQFSARKALGCGAYGKVLLVTHQKTRLNYALKCISKKPLTKHKHLAFIKEQKDSLSLLSLKASPFIVRYYRSFKDNYYIYFLTEHIEGRDLFDVIRMIGMLTLEQVRFYVATLIHILEVIHQESIIYRDLKPENIMVGRDGYLKLVDMGTCKKLLEHQSKTFSFIGTPQYMAPQVFIHKGYSYHADLWSLGVIFYELLAGKNPFIDGDTDDMKEIYDKIMTSPLTFDYFLKDERHYLMKHAKALISQLLDKKNPTNRLGGSFADLRSHPFFNGFDWQTLYNRTMQPAYLIKNQHMLNQERIKQLPQRSILTHLRDWNCEMPKIKGVPEGWDEYFAF